VNLDSITRLEPQHPVQSFLIESTENQASLELSPLDESFFQATQK
jgi:hypothetical protein